MYNKIYVWIAARRGFQIHVRRAAGFAFFISIFSLANGLTYFCLPNYYTGTFFTYGFLYGIGFSLCYVPPMAAAMEVSCHHGSREW